MDGPRIIRSFVDLRALELQKERDQKRVDPPRVDPPTDNPPAITAETVEKTAHLDAPKPRYGGLHQLAVAEFPLSPNAEPNFSEYRVGFNNRGLLGSIAQDLNKRFGTNISYGYSSSLEAYAHREGSSKMGFGQRGAGFAIGEKAIDVLVANLQPGVEMRAIATFAIAHEFFHSLLRHPETLDYGLSTPRGWKVKDSAQQRRLYELQADYLAARYVRLLGLPIEPLLDMFTTQDFTENKDYPSGPARAENVKSAFEGEFRLELFSNEIVDCLDFLESLVIK